MSSLDQKPRTVLVTGGAQGIGRGIAEQLIKEGWAVGLIDIHPDVENIAEQIGALAAYKIDLRDVESGKQAVREFHDRAGGLGALVNCAGTCHRESFEDTNLANWNLDVATNLTGLFFLCHSAVFPFMKDQGYGRIVNIGSVSGKIGGIGPVHEDGSGGRSGAAYAASKAGVINVTRWVAKEVGRWGITANTVAPGPIETPMTQGAEYDVSDIPMRRMGQPADIVGATSFLLGEAAGFVTGTVLHVDGGLVLA